MGAIREGGAGLVAMCPSSEGETGGRRGLEARLQGEALGASVWGRGWRQVLSTSLSALVTEGRCWRAT